MNQKIMISLHKHLYKFYVRGERRSLIIIKCFDLNNYIKNFMFTKQRFSYTNPNIINEKCNRI